MELDPEPLAAGAKAALSDIAKGLLMYRWTGHTGHWGHWIVAELAKRFGVGVNDGFGICMVTQSGISFDEGYNRVSSEEINRRHGTGAFESVLSEAREQSEMALWDAKQAWFATHPELA